MKKPKKIQHMQKPEKIQHMQMPEKWDPRFDLRAGGEFDRTTFRKRYGFIDEMRENEAKVSGMELLISVLL